MEIIDMIEEIEKLVPEYSYASIEKIISTDERVRQALVEELKQAKDYMFHAVQITYELQKDSLSEAAHEVWDDTDRLLGQAQNLRSAALKDRPKHVCEGCRHRVEHNLAQLIMIDRELLKNANGLKRRTHSIYRLMMSKGNEGQFIKSLAGIKKYKSAIGDLCDRRDSIIMGV